MKKLYFSIVFVVLTLNALCQNKVNLNGYNVFYYSDGTISSEGNMKRGKPDGYWITYYPTGIKKSEGNRKNTELDSIWSFYDMVGNVIKTISYRNGKKNGYLLNYSYKEDPNGIIISKEIYIDNKIEGKAFYYYDNGKLKKEAYFEDGKLEGQAFEYNLKGELTTIYYYKDGRLYDVEKVNRVNKDGQKIGIWREYYANGRIKEENSYNKGKLDGYSKEFNEMGELVLTLEYQNDVLIKRFSEDSIKQNVEIREERYPNGNKKYSGSFIEDVPVGIHREYNERGVVINTKIYSDKGVLIAKGILTDEGKREGDWKYFYSNGNVKNKGMYRRNSRQGQWSFYHPNGKMFQEGNYLNGRYEGEWNWYYEDGSSLRREFYDQGELMDEYIEYNDSGEVVSKGMYNENEKEGKWFYSVGDHKEVGNYELGLKDGKWKHYYLSNGKIRFEGNFVRGKPDGRHRYYYDNGNLMEERFYERGIKEGNWSKYKRNGQKVITVTYYRNKEIRINGKKVDENKKD